MAKTKQDPVNLTPEELEWIGQDIVQREQKVTDVDDEEDDDEEDDDEGYYCTKRVKLVHNVVQQPAVTSTSSSSLSSSPSLSSSSSSSTSSTSSSSSSSSSSLLCNVTKKQNGLMGFGFKLKKNTSTNSPISSIGAHLLKKTSSSDSDIFKSLNTSVRVENPNEISEENPLPITLRTGEAGETEVPERSNLARKRKQEKRKALPMDITPTKPKGMYRRIYIKIYFIVYDLITLTYFASKTNSGGTYAQAKSRLDENPNIFKLHPVTSGEANVEKRYELHCFFCFNTIGCQKHVVASHLKTERHKAGVIKHAEEARQRKRLRDSFGTSGFQERGQGTVPDEVLEFRVSVLRSLMVAGIPLNKLGPLRPLYERLSGYKLTDRSHLSNFIDILYEDEINLIRNEIKGRKVVVIFDGTTTVGEIFAVIFRWVDENLIIRHRLVSVGVYKSSMNNLQLIDAITRVVQIRYQIDVEDVIGWMRDRASVNTAAIASLLRMYENSHDLECLSHTISHCGDKMLGSTQYAKKLMGSLTNLLSGSNRAFNVWREVTGTTWKKPSNSRWWAKQNCIEDVLNKFPNVVRFVQTARDGGRCNRGANLEFLEPFMDNVETREGALLDLTVMQSVGRPLYQVTYILEGDGPLMFIAQGMFDFLTAEFERSVPHLEFHGVPEAIDKFAEVVFQIYGDEDYAETGFAGARQRVCQYVSNIVAPVVDYYYDVVLSKLNAMHALSSAGCLINPCYVKRMRPGRETFREKFLALGVFSEAKIEQVLGEVNHFNNLVTTMELYLGLACAPH